MFYYLRTIKEEREEKKRNEENSKRDENRMHINVMCKWQYDT